MGEHRAYMGFSRDVIMEFGFRVWIQEEHGIPSDNRKPDVKAVIPDKSHAKKLDIPIKTNKIFFFFGPTLCCGC